MKIFHSISEFVATKKTILTLGTFDGVHFGHKTILNKVTQSTLHGTYESVVLTFFPHPRMVLQEKSDIKLLNTIAEKIELLEQLGIENLVIHPFDTTFSKLTAEEFVRDILVNRFNIQKIIIGYDHRFGRNRTANINDLITYGKIYNFEVEQITAQEINAISVSSTKIRNAILEGDLTLAATYLGYPYPISGKVVKGKQLGRTIGFPTANIAIAEDFKLIPKNGVYVVKSHINHQTIYGMMNIGFNPTVGGEKQSIEVHFLDFDKDVYHRELTISILHRLRWEHKFQTIDLLKAQLAQDESDSRDYIARL
ncbi:bifunctional riboflavin kinase/FAD synthetase [Flavobacterium sp.]|uniref:bifunctional riboflavin kinase/FAD synthetase n=1 Tax=Flavobacterium sp. TaxID=239 RepID=UPI0022BF2729|nr:bifunctional riboflavin kinase/FAD synthetase [Flavobacterium sp.]MCZ8228931.1 bifunctional riboflavin kinase/FAD synthetase [Flavobacterium sp.]